MGKYNRQTENLLRQFSRDERKQLEAQYSKEELEEKARLAMQVARMTADESDEEEEEETDEAQTDETNEHAERVNDLANDVEKFISTLTPELGAFTYETLTNMASFGRMCEHLKESGWTTDEENGGLDAIYKAFVSLSHKVFNRIVDGAEYAGKQAKSATA